MKYIVVDETTENCFMADSEKEIVEGLEEYDWALAECSIYERGDPIKFELTLVRKIVPTLTRKEK